MNSKPTFQQQFDKIAAAYLAGRLGLIGQTHPVSMLIDCCIWEDAITTNMKEVAPNMHSLRITTQGIPREAMRVIAMHVSHHAGGMYDLQDLVELHSHFISKFYTKLAEEKGDTEKALFKAVRKFFKELAIIHRSKGEEVRDYMFIQRPNTPAGTTKSEQPMSTGDLLLKIDALKKSGTDAGVPGELLDAEINGLKAIVQLMDKLDKSGAQSN
jgi:hypothetical protein